MYMHICDKYYYKVGYSFNKLIKKKKKIKTYETK